MGDRGEGMGYCILRTNQHEDVVLGHDGALGAVEDGHVGHLVDEYPRENGPRGGHVPEPLGPPRQVWRMQREAARKRDEQAEEGGSDAHDERWAGKLGHCQGHRPEGEEVE